MNRDEKQVLMIAAAFPPIGGPGVQRTLKFAKYLPQFGWRPIVWCLDEMKGLPIDATLLDELPRDVQRIPASTLVRKSSWRLTGTSGGLSSIRPGTMGGPTRVMDAEKWVDEFVPVAAGCVDSLVELIKSRSIDAIYSTFSPPTNHWLGHVLKARTHCPWIADFRDLWIDDCRYHEPSSRVHELRCRFQRSVLTEADAVVGVSGSQTRILANHVNGGIGKFQTITNGFDPEDFVGVTNGVSCRDRFVITHVGRFDRWRATDALLSGLLRFVETVGGHAGVEIRLVGHTNREWVDRGQLLGLPLTVVPYVSHHEAIQLMADAHALLLPVPEGRNSETVIAAKVFEYLAVRRPILVVSPMASETARIVMDVGAGMAVDHDESQIHVALCAMFDRWRDGQRETGVNDVLLNRYNRIELTRRLASLLDEVVGTNVADHRATSAAAVARHLVGREQIGVSRQ